MADNPEIKAFEDFHKHSTGMYKAAHAIDGAVANAQKGMLNDLNKFYQTKTADKALLEFKDELSARKASDDVFTSAATALFGNYLATNMTPEQRGTSLKDNKRLAAGIEDLLELKYGMKRNELTGKMASQKYFNAEDMLEIVGKLFESVKENEMQYLGREATKKFWEDPKTFNKYLRTVLADNSTNPAIPAVFEGLKKNGIKAEHLLDPSKKDVIDSNANHAVWSLISRNIGNEYDFKAKIQKMKDAA